MKAMIIIVSPTKINSISDVAVKTLKLNNCPYHVDIKKLDTVSYELKKPNLCTKFLHLLIATSNCPISKDLYKAVVFAFGGQKI